MDSSASSKEHPGLLPDVALVLVTAIWGSTFIVNEVVLSNAPPLGFLALRFAVGGAVLLVLALPRPRTPGVWKDGAIIGALLAAGIGLQLVGQLFTTASKAAFVTGLSVPLTPVVGFLLTRKLPTLTNLIGLVVATGGFVLLAWPSDASGVNLGDLFILGTAFSYAYLIVYMSETAGLHDVRWYSATQILFATLFVGLVRLALMPFASRPEPVFVAEARPIPWNMEFLAAILWMGLMATVVTFLVQTWAQGRMSATHAAIIFALEPVFTALFAALLLHERLGAAEWWGGGLVLLGIVISELPSSRK